MSLKKPVISILLPEYNSDVKIGDFYKHAAHNFYHGLRCGVIDTHFKPNIAYWKSIECLQMLTIIAIWLSVT